MRTLELQVANTNQAPVLLPLPLQLVYEGDTLGFTVQGVDPYSFSYTVRNMGSAVPSTLRTGGICSQAS